MRYPLILGLLAVLSTACADRETNDDPPVNPNRSRVLALVPVFPGAVLTDTTGSPEAERFAYMSSASFDSVSRFYRREMPADGWSVMNDLGDSTIMNLYLRKDSATVWIRAVPREGGGTVFELLSSTISGTPRDTMN